ncbi:hypothetical protein L210DRAFT_3509223 [Boletus edulis BED1]|uniref:Uncharacterized protein n=1 Tax=Boletus edulis BED1 TaxID=1328754 RepID=A0AAD4BFT4_BOLED|nr:hypothetical protein L210DRAFT_3509223 [Boletus edulis BED1]
MTNRGNSGDAASDARDGHGHFSVLSPARSNILRALDSRFNPSGSQTWRTAPLPILASGRANFHQFPDGCGAKGAFALPYNFKPVFILCKGARLLFEDPQASIPLLPLLHPPPSHLPQAALPHSGEDGDTTQLMMSMMQPQSIPPPPRRHSTLPPPRCSFTPPDKVLNFHAFGQRNRRAMPQLKKTNFQMRWTAAYGEAAERERTGPHADSVPHASVTLRPGLASARSK